MGAFLERADFIIPLDIGQAICAIYLSSFER